VPIPDQTALISTRQIRQRDTARFAALPSENPTWSATCAQVNPATLACHAFTARCSASKRLLTAFVPFIWHPRHQVTHSDQKGTRGDTRAAGSPGVSHLGRTVGRRGRT